MLDLEAPYTREEVKRYANERPLRGLQCSRCGIRVPQFLDLTPEGIAQVLERIGEGKAVAATYELRRITGCSLDWAKIWVQHRGQPELSVPTAACPQCGGQLRTATAKQCRHCGANWHDLTGEES